MRWWPLRSETHGFSTAQHSRGIGELEAFFLFCFVSLFITSMESAMGLGAGVVKCELVSDPATAERLD